MMKYIFYTIAALLFLGSASLLAQAEPVGIQWAIMGAICLVLGGIERAIGHTKEVNKTIHDNI